MLRVSIASHNPEEIFQIQGLYDSLHALTLTPSEGASGSMMRKILSYWKDARWKGLDETVGKVFVARRHHGKKIIGWAIINESKWIMIYVQKGLRRQGVGTALIVAAVAYCDKTDTPCFVTPWDKRSIGFYAETGFKHHCCVGGYARWRKALPTDNVNITASVTA